MTETEHAIDMVSPLPGFETCRRYQLTTAPDIAPFARIEGLDGARPAFLALPPQAVTTTYRQTISAADRERLGATPDEPLLWLSIVRIEGERAFANLRAPLVINPRRMLGLQIVSQDDDLPIDHPLLLD